MISQSQHDWSLHRKGLADQARHQEKIRDAIKQKLPEIIAFVLRHRAKIRHFNDLALLRGNAHQGAPHLSRHHRNLRFSFGIGSAVRFLRQRVKAARHRPPVRAGNRRRWYG